MRTEIEKEFLLRAIDAIERDIIILSPQYRILAANRFAREKHGSDIIGKTCHEVFDHGSHCDDCPVNTVLRTKLPFLGKKKRRRNDPIQGLTCYPVFFDNQIEFLLMVDFNPPQLNQLEEELHRSNEFLRNLIMSAVDGVIAADKTGKIFIFNEAAAEVSGYSIEEALEKLYIQEIYPAGGAYDIMRVLRMEEYGGKGKLKRYHVDILSKEGRPVPISLYAAIVYDGEREVATIGFFHDMRERLQMKKELEQIQLQLLQSEKMAALGKLAAGVAHQINNPLGGITLFAKLLLEEYTLPDGAGDDVNRILRDAQRCKETVKELLEFSRQTRQVMRPSDLNRALNRTLFLLESQTLFQNIEIVKHLEADLPLVNADVQQLGHVFMNIILNAAQAMAGKGRLTLKSYPLPDEQRICIEISDTGPGIEPDVLPQIFDPFFTTKEEGKGTGLGLSLVYGIIRHHKGRITAHSDIGRGTTFKIELPRIPATNNGGDASGA